MGYGTWGFIGGAAKAGQKYGEALMEDEFDKRREERLQKAKEELEASRRQWEAQEHDRRLELGNQNRFGANAARIPEVGTIGLENENEISQFEKMIPFEAQKAEQVTAATGRGHFGRDEEAHRRAKELRAMQDAAALEREKLGETGAGGFKPAGATELNHTYRVISQQFGGTFDTMGNMIKPPDAPEKVEEAYRIAVQLMEPDPASGRQPMSLGQATAKAVELVGGQLSEEDAMAQARELARKESFGMFGGESRKKWEEDKARELVEESRSRTRGLLSGGATPAGPATPAAPAGGRAFRTPDGETITMAEIEATARQHGHTPEQVIEILRQRGIIVGE